MRFECDCKTERGFQKLMDTIHHEKFGVSFETPARLWITSKKFGKTLMIEHQVTTMDVRELTEDAGQPDWFTAYEVRTERDDDCSCEIETEIVKPNISLKELKKSMMDFANEVFARYYR